jgi:hypothetical protein
MHLICLVSAVNRLIAPHRGHFISASPLTFANRRWQHAHLKSIFSIFTVRPFAHKKRAIR